MIRAKWGRIVNITSVFGAVSKEYRAAYSSSKFGLDGMTVSLENSEDVNTLGVTYASGAISVAVEADDATAETWEATMAYDLGGGATFNLGTNQAETTFAGVGFSF